MIQKEVTVVTATQQAIQNKIQLLVEKKTRELLEKKARNGVPQFINEQERLVIKTEAHYFHATNLQYKRYIESIKMLVSTLERLDHYDTIPQNANDDEDWREKLIHNEITDNDMDKWMSEVGKTVRKEVKTGTK